MSEHYKHTEDLLISLKQPIAVVGNGHMDRPLGNVIDRFPTVIRLNNFRLEGFEEVVGTRTTIRCTSGWADIEARGCALEISPFTHDSRESGGILSYTERSSSTLLTAKESVHELSPQIANPSTGLAILILCSHLGIEVSAFGFDGFRTGHYWSQDQKIDTTHSQNELNEILSLPHVTFYGKSYPYEELYNFCHEKHEGYNINEGLALFKGMSLQISGERIIEFGAGNGELSAWLEQTGNQVTALEVSKTAFDRIPTQNKINGDILTFARIDDQFDRVVSIDVLEHLTENDIHIFFAQAARLARKITVTVSTRTSGLLGPNGENLHLTVRSAEWWTELISKYYITEVTVGMEVGQLIFFGERIDEYHTSAAKSAAQSSNYELPSNYQSRTTPAYYEDTPSNNGGVTWQPDVYPTAADIARALKCDTIIDIGCGHAGKLSTLKEEFNLIGVDYGPNIEFCRSNFQFAVWLESDLEQVSIIPIPEKVLSNATIVCSDVIEHLRNPQKLINQLKKMLTSAPALVLSTPDRIRTYGLDHNGPPPNPAHIREWSKDELTRLLEKEGFHLATATYTRSNDASSALNTILIVAINPAHPGMQRPYRT